MEMGRRRRQRSRQLEVEQWQAGGAVVARQCWPGRGGGGAAGSGVAAAVERRR